jgi:hypothetical protein
VAVAVGVSVGVSVAVSVGVSVTVSVGGGVGDSVGVSVVVGVTSVVGVEVGPAGVGDAVVVAVGVAVAGVAVAGVAVGLSSPSQATSASTSMSMVTSETLAIDTGSSSNSPLFGRGGGCQRFPALAAKPHNTGYTAREPDMKLLLAFLTATSFLLAACASDEGTGTPGGNTDEPQGTATATATGTSTSDGTTPTTPPGAGPDADLATQAIAEADNIRVTLLHIEDPWEQPVGEPEPPAGTRYVQVAVTIENYSGRPYQVAFDDFIFYGGGQATEGIDIGGADPYLSTQTLAADATIQGFVVGEVVEGDEFSGLTFDADTATEARVTFGEATVEEPEPTATTTGTPDGDETPDDGVTETPTSDATSPLEY